MARKGKAEMSDIDDDFGAEAPEVSAPDADAVPAAKARSAEAKRAAKKVKEPVPILKTWFEIRLGSTFNPAKGRKVILKQRTPNGTTTEFVGYENKIGEAFKARMKDEGGTPLFPKAKGVEG